MRFLKTLRVNPSTAAMGGQDWPPRLPSVASRSIKSLPLPKLGLGSSCWSLGKNIIDSCDSCELAAIKIQVRYRKRSNSTINLPKGCKLNKITYYYVNYSLRTGIFFIYTYSYILISNFFSGVLPLRGPIPLPYLT